VHEYKNQITDFKKDILAVKICASYP